MMAEGSARGAHRRFTEWRCAGGPAGGARARDRPAARLLRREQRGYWREQAPHEAWCDDAVWQTVLRAGEWQNNLYSSVSASGVRVTEGALSVFGQASLARAARLPF